MPTNAEFSPGARISRLDHIILALGVVGTVALGAIVWWAGFVVAFVVAHFFLFCNVFRISRPLELAWSAAFVAFAAGTVLISFPGWLGTAVLSLAGTASVILLEMQKPSYHGIGWQKINPGLENWWKANRLPHSPAG